MTFNDEIIGIEDINQKEKFENLLLLHTALFFARENCHQVIDKIYNNNELGLRKCYTESKEYDFMNEALKSFRGTTSVYAERALAIIIDGNNNSNYDNILEILKRSYRRYYKTVTEALDKKKINYNNIYNSIINSSNTPWETNLIAIALIYILYKLDIKIEISLVVRNEIIEVINDFYLFFIYKESNFSERAIKEQSEFLTENIKNLGIKNKNYAFNDIINKIIVEEVKRNKNKYYGISLSDLHLKIQKEGDISKYIGAYEGFMKALNVFVYDLFKDTIISNTDLKNILLSYKYGEMFNHFKEEDKNLYLISSLYFMAMHKEYVSLKEEFVTFKNNDSAITEDLLKKEIEKLQNKNFELKQEINEDKKINEEKTSELLKEIEALKKENLELNRNKIEYSELKKEVIKLREHVFNLSKRENEGDYDISESEIIGNEKLFENLLSDKKIIVVGGSPYWIKALKGKFKDIIVVSDDIRNSDFSFMANADYVFLNHNMPHALTEKAMKYINKFNREYCYLSYPTNIELSIKEMLEILNN